MLTSSANIGQCRVSEPFCETDDRRRASHLPTKLIRLDFLGGQDLPLRRGACEEIRTTIGGHHFVVGLLVVRSRAGS